MTYSRVSCAEGHPCSCMMGELRPQLVVGLEAVSNLRIHASRSTEISGIGTSCCAQLGGRMTRLPPEDP